MTFDRTVSPNDNMMTASEEAYFNTTKQAMACILGTLSDVGRAPEDIHTVMDFGCGYGRVYRGLAAAFPEARLTACDLIKDGAEFCAATFGGTPVQSSAAFQVDFPDTYDLIWLGSVFTHLPEDGWAKLLSLLARNTNPGGIVVFTTHGTNAIRHMEEVILARNPNLIDAAFFARMKETLPEEGFAFVTSKPATYNHQIKIGMNVDRERYGFSFTTRAWIEAYFTAHPDWVLADYREPGWGRNHDSVGLRRR